MNDPASLLALEGVTCIRGGRLLFEGLDLALGAGEAVVVTGPNGAGKSSLLRICARLLRPAAGSVQGAPTALADDALALDPRLPLSRALGYWARLDGGGAGATMTAMTAMALTGLADVPVRMLSTGQRKRAGLARAIASGAPLWLLDEPVNGLDAASINRLAAAVAAHRAAGGGVLAAAHQALPFAEARTLALGA